jgi:hypothetical protein
MRHRLTSARMQVLLLSVGDTVSQYKRLLRRMVRCCLGVRGPPFM